MSSLCFFFGLFCCAQEKDKSAAKDLGVWHVANTLANIITPFGAGALLDLFKQVVARKKKDEKFFLSKETKGISNGFGGGARFGYTVVFSIATFLFSLSAALISRVKVGGRKVVENIELSDLMTQTTDRELSVNKEE